MTKRWPSPRLKDGGRPKDGGAGAPERSRQSSFAARASATTEAAFRSLARLRRAPAVHPHGLTCAAGLEVLGGRGRPWGVRWLDTPGRHAATVRLSRAVGLPRRFPDGLGLALRVEHADGGDACLDLLLTSSGRGRITRHVPLPRADALGCPYSTMLPYRVGGHRRVLAAFPRPSWHGPVHGDPASLSEALDGGPLVFDLCAEDSGPSWRAFAVLTVHSVLPGAREDSPGFDIYAHDLPGFTPGDALAVSRQAAYRGSRAGRRGDRRGG